MRMGSLVFSNDASIIMSSTLRLSSVPIMRTYRWDKAKTLANLMRCVRCYRFLMLFLRLGKRKNVCSWDLFEVESSCNTHCLFFLIYTAVCYLFQQDYTCTLKHPTRV